MSDTALSPTQDSRATRTTMMCLSMLVALTVTLASCTHSPARSTSTTADKIIEAYGGRERLSKVVSVAAEGRITALMRGDEGTYKRTFRRDGKLLVDIIYRRSTERRILNGAKGFRSTGGKAEEVYGPRYLAMVHQYNELNLPYGLLDNSFGVTELRRETLHNADVLVLRCSDHAGNEMEVFVSVDTYRIVKCVGAFAMGTQSTSLSAEFSDFRTIDGVLLPFRIVNYAGGNKISETIMTRYLINPAIGDSLFTP